MGRMSDRALILWAPTASCLLLLVLLPADPLLAQAPPLPDPSPSTDVQVPPGVESTPAPASDTAALERRVQELEAMVRASVGRQMQLEETIRAMNGGTVIPAPVVPGASTGGGSITVPYPANTAIMPLSSAAVPTPNMPARENELMRGGTAGLSATAPASSSTDMPPPALKLPLGGTFGNGFEFKTEDDEYVLQFHNLTQFDGRFYLEGTQQPVRDTFVIPREWFIFNGRLTKPWEYYIAFAEGIDTLNLLDAYLNIHYDDRLQIRFGRYKTPFTYEFYALPVQGLITPERSLFFNNFAVNRDLGIMTWGQLAEKRIDYAVGVFNGTRNDYVDTNDEKDVMAFLNFKPWTNTDGPLKGLNFGGSVDAGMQNNPTLPQTLRTLTPTAGNSAVGTAFLSFFDTVRETGYRNFWSTHLAYYGGPLSVIAEYESGYQYYAFTNRQQTRLKTPVQSFYVQAGYFLTGETVSSRGMTRPNRPFDVRKGQRGPGAFELVGRYNFMNIGRDIFNARLANPNDWTNQVWLTDLGLNWYPNQFIKFFLGWEHAEFGDPVLFAPNRHQLTSDLFWLRTQIYF